MSDKSKQVGAEAPGMSAQPKQFERMSETEYERLSQLFDEWGFASLTGSARTKFKNIAIVFANRVAARASVSPPQPQPFPFPYGLYSSPDPAIIAENKLAEPIGERIRQELAEFIERNGIVDAIVELEHHAVRFQSDNLPPEIKSVLTCYGSIFVRNEERFTFETASVSLPQPQSDLLEAMRAIEHGPAAEIVEDGFGSEASVWCPECRCKSMYVCRPGDIRCSHCYDGNPIELSEPRRPAPSSEAPPAPKCYHLRTMGHEWETWCEDCGERWPNGAAYLNNNSVTITKAAGEAAPLSAPTKEKR